MQKLSKLFPKGAYSPVCNASLMYKLIVEGLVNDYFLFLAHDVAASKHVYERLRNKISPFATVILDNSLIELGGAVNYEVMDIACKYINPDFIVLPDVLLNRKETIKAASEVFNQWRSLLRPTQYGTESKFLAVLQGNSEYELLECAQQYCLMDTDNCIGAFGIPRAFGNLIGTRNRIIRKLFESGNDNFCKPIHLLGFSANLADDLSCAGMPLVMGIDSATPIRVGAEHLKLNMHDKSDPAKLCKVKREIFFEKALEVTSEMFYNIGYINGAINGMQQ